jgi:toxin ParE1/3/4
MKYWISREASIDLEEIWLYTFENWSIEQADRYLIQIKDEIVFLAKKPESGFNYGHFRKGYFRSKVKSHFIFYRINHDEDRIEIIRVLHQRMDRKQVGCLKNCTELILTSILAH